MLLSILLALFLTPAQAAELSISAPEIKGDWAMFQVSYLPESTDPAEAYLEINRIDRTISQVLLTEGTRQLAIGINDLVDESELAKLEHGESLPVKLDFAVKAGNLSISKLDAQKITAKEIEFSIKLK